MTKKVKRIWCNHCNAEISAAGVRSCLRRTCESKDLLEEQSKD